MPGGNPNVVCTHVTEECTVEQSIYGYRPNLPATCFFVAVFAVCLIANLSFGIRYGKSTATYTLAMVLATVAAIIGNAARIPMHYNPYNNVGFEAQICCLTISPAFNSAAIYLMMKHIVRRFGRDWSRIRPKYYTWGFISADVLALIFQGSGGAIAATSTTTKQLNLGSNLMIAGIIWQVVTLVVFGIAISDYLIRRFRSSTPLSDEAQSTINDRKFKLFIASLPVVYVAVLIRCIYRVIEMAGGWGNPTMQDQLLFLILDSTMVALATLLQTFVHPGYCFPGLGRKHATDEEKTLSDSAVEQAG